MSTFNPLTPADHKKIIHKNLKLKTAGLLKYVWPFCQQQQHEQHFHYIFKMAAPKIGSHFV